MKRALLPIFACVLVACSRPVQSFAAASSVTPVASESAVADTTVFLLDGTEIRRGDVAKIDAAQIESIRHLVGATAREYRPGVREIVEIVTRDIPDSSEFTAPLILLDGLEISAKLARVLDRAKIASIDVVKGDAARPYGERGNAGIVVIKSKTRLE